MSRTDSPLRYPGGKSSTYKYIKQLIIINKANTYIEPFAGGAGVAISLLLNNDVKKIILNDYDRSIYALWYSILNHMEDLSTKIEQCDITIEEWYKQKSIQKNKDSCDLLDLGFSTLFLNRTNRSGIIKGGVIGGKDQNGNYKLDCRFNKVKLIEKIKMIAAKKSRIELYNEDALVLIDTVIKHTRNSFTFFDPPYFEKGPSLYTNFYSDDDHENLVKKIKDELKNRKWIVTYDHTPEIKEMYSKLEYIEYSLSYTAQEKTRGIEYMFFSKKTNSCNPEKYLTVLKELTLL